MEVDNNDANRETQTQITNTNFKTSYFLQQNAHVFPFAL